jgi:predicted alpha/beta-hydrolase family hydrolase
MSGGKKRAPPKAEKLVEFHSNIVKETATKYPGHPLILAGKSMGSRCILYLLFLNFDLDIYVCMLKS